MIPFSQKINRRKTHDGTVQAEGARILVYSHDTYGLGNIRRMLAVCEGLMEAMPDASILLVTGSPMVHGFRLPNGLDYIKLPCLSRTERDGYSTKLLRTGIDETLRLRSNIIKCAALAFDPHVMIVDKKPFGIKNELQRPLQALRALRPSTQYVLILRDILDSPEATAAEWERNGFQNGAKYYDELLVLGSKDVFDFACEYGLTHTLAEKLHHCGYTRRSEETRSAADVRLELSVGSDEKLVLVTPGGGEDGFAMIDTYVQGLAHRPYGAKIRSLIIHGPEIPEGEQQALRSRLAGDPSVVLRRFTDDMRSYMAAADAVVSMGGYNTVCEILSLNKRAIIVPRVRPVEEQLIRAERMQALELLTMLHPDVVTPARMMSTVLAELAQPGERQKGSLDLNALPRVAARVKGLLENHRAHSVPRNISIDSYAAIAAAR